MDHDTIAQVHRLKYRYLRTLDLKLWDEFADTLAEDVQASYGPKLSFDGRAAVVAFMRESLPASRITVHHCHHPEIEIDGATATGTWYLDDRVIVSDYGLLITGAAFYEDVYTQGTDGIWRISRTGYIRSYEAMQKLPADWRMTANRFEEAHP